MILKILIDDKTAIIEWYISSEQIFAFIIRRDYSAPIVFDKFTTEDAKELIKFEKEYFGTYLSDRRSWRSRLDSLLSRLSSILKVEEIIERYLLDSCEEIIFIPHRTLHIFPMHALPLLNGKCVLDKFPGGVRYSPSCQMLKLNSSQGESLQAFDSLLAVQNPTEDLGFADFEVEEIASLFDNKPRVLKRDEARKSDVVNMQTHSKQRYLHFACHGSFNLGSPLASSLVLADKQNLTLSEIFSLNLKDAYLVTLSACETGLTDFRSISDEYVGLPSGFLYAGSSNVVSSLWTVDDLSTAFLNIQFYINLKDFDRCPNAAVALNQAQQWLRNITKKELEIWIAERQFNISSTLRKGLDYRLQKLSDDDQPFNSPFYWAAFCAIGES
ncbi:MAG: CHAT domain-containing protein [Cyanobacteria bacterium J06650_10]